MKKFLKKIFRFFGFDIIKYKNSFPLLHFLTTHSIQTVIDVGANIGQFSSLVREVLPQAEIYAFEPINETYKTLKEAYKNDTHYHCYKLALGAEKTTREMFKNEYAPSSSLLENTSLNDELFPHTKNVSKETIEITRLDEINVPVEKNLLLKLDAQGFELEVFKGGMKTLRQAEVIIIEVSFVELYKNQPLFDELYQFLRAEGFVYQGSLQNKYDHQTNKILFEDAIFTKK